MRRGNKLGFNLNQPSIPAAKKSQQDFDKNKLT